MTTVDRRVVEMGFDNKQFEGGVKTTLNSLNDLKKGLNLDESTRSLAGLEKAGKNFTLTGMADSLQTVSNRFSTMGIIGITVIQNLTNAAINFGKQIVNALAIKPLKAGLNEYETQLNAIQTVLANTASKGTNLQQVNDALDQLNEYADKTIYNFTEMTRNIGTFTAAGIDLDKSVAAIKGIANLAAVSGSNSQQASTAMYQLSQALASGTVKLMDWNSVVNAGMGGQVFQDALKETARVHGVAIDKMITSEGSFRETLQKGWLTSEILLETLQKFTGDLTNEQLISMGYTEEQIAAIVKLGETANDAATKVKTFTQLKDTLAEAIQSGWGQTFRIILGDFEEAKGFFTELNDILSALVGQSSEARNVLLQQWKDLGGRTAIVKALMNTLEGLLRITKPIGEAFAEILPPVTAVQLANFSKKIRELTERLLISAETAEKIKRVFKGVASVFDIVRMFGKALLDIIAPLAKKLEPLGGKFLDFAAGIGDYLVNLRNTIKDNDLFAKSFVNIGLFLKNIQASLKQFGKTVVTTFDNFKTSLQTTFAGLNVGPIRLIMGAFISLGTAIGTFLSNLDFSGFNNFITAVKTRFAPLKGTLASVGNTLKTIGAIMLTSMPTFSQLGDIISKTFGRIKSVVSGVIPAFSKLGDVLGEFFKGLNKGMDGEVSKMEFSGLFDALNAGLLAGLILAIRKFIGEGASVFEGITDILDGVKGSLEAWQESLKAKTLLTIAFAIGVLALAMIGLASIDSERLTASIVAMSIMFAELMGAMAVFGKVSGDKDAVKAAGMLLVISAAIGILALAMVKISAVDPEEMKTGLIGIGVLLAELAIFMKTANFGGGGFAKISSLLALSVAVLILSKAVASFGNIDQAKAMQGLKAMGIVLAELAIFSQLTGNSKNIISTAAGLLIIGGALLIFAKAISVMGDLPTDQVQSGLFTIAAALTIVAAAFNLMPDNVVATAVSLAIVSAAIFLLSKSLEALSKMSLEEIGRSLGTLAGSLAILGLAMSVMQSSLAGAASLFIAAAAISILAPALGLLGQMPLKAIGTALLAIAGTFAVLGLAGLILAPLVPVLLALGAAMILFGVAIAAVGVGILAFSTGMAALAISGTAGIAAMTAIVTAIMALMPLIGRGIADAMKSFITSIGESFPLLAETFRTVLLSLINVIVSVIPPLIQAVLLIVTTLLQAIAEKLPAIIEAGMQIVTALLTGIRDNIGPIVTIAADILINFLNALSEKIPEVVTAGWEFIISFIDGMTQAVTDNMPRLLESISNLAVAVIDGLAAGLVAGIPKLVESITNLGNEIVNTIKELLGIKSPSTVFTLIGEDIVQGLIDGINNFVSAAVDTAKNLMDNVSNKVKDFIAVMYEIGRLIVEGLAQGIRDYIWKAVRSARTLAQQVVDAIKRILGIQSPSKEGADIGMYLVEGVSNGINKFANLAINAAKDLGTSTMDSLDKAISDLSNKFGESLDLNPSIKPVVDLTDVLSGTKEISNIFGSQSPYISATSNRLSSISNGMRPDSGNLNVETPQGPSISLTQNNYSPKELSRLELYRQTRNLLETLKGMA